MSSVVKGVKKAFKKVYEGVKKVAPVVLAAAAVYFTAGAAMGATAGWGATAGSMGTAMGGSGVVGGAMSGAISSAGYGAMAGGVISEMQGGSFTEGAKQGAAAGAVTGGVMGGIGAAGGAQPQTAGQQAGMESADAAGAQVTPGVESAGEQAGMPAPGGPNAAAGGSPAPSAQPGAGGTGASPAPAAASGGGGGGGGLMGRGGWVERNQDLIGKTMGGIGKGLMSQAESEAAGEAERERWKRIQESHAGVDPSASFKGLAPGESGQSPQQRFDPLSYGQFEYQFNPKSGRIERVPRNA